MSLGHDPLVTEPLVLNGQGRATKMAARLPPHPRGFPELTTVVLTLLQSCLKHFPHHPHYQVSLSPFIIKPPTLCEGTTEHVVCLSGYFHFAKWVGGSSVSFHASSVCLFDC
jgi:hypothetical protein